MRRVVRSALLAGAVAAVMLVPVVPSTAEGSGNWVRVDQVLVNKLGGVSVVGSVDCTATYEALTNGGLMVEG